MDKEIIWARPPCLHDLYSSWMLWPLSHGETCGELGHVIINHWLIDIDCYWWMCSSRKYSYSPHEKFFCFAPPHPPPPGISSLASYFSKSLAFKIHLPLGVSSDLLWVGGGSMDTFWNHVIVIIIDYWFYWLVRPDLFYYFSLAALDKIN